MTRTRRASRAGRRTRSRPRGRAGRRGTGLPTGRARATPRPPRGATGRRARRRARTPRRWPRRPSCYPLCSSFHLLLRGVRRLRGRGLLLAQLLVAAALALPRGEDARGVARVLIDRAVGRDDLAAARGAHAPAYRLPLHVNRRD